MNASADVCEDFYGYSCGNTMNGSSFHKEMWVKRQNETFALLQDTEKLRKHSASMPIFGHWDRFMRECEDISSRRKEPNWKEIAKFLLKPLKGSMYDWNSRTSIFRDNFYLNYLKLSNPWSSFRPVSFFCKPESQSFDLKCYLMRRRECRINKKVVLENLDHVVKAFEAGHRKIKQKNSHKQAVSAFLDAVNAICQLVEDDAVSEELFQAENISRKTEELDIEANKPKFNNFGRFLHKWKKESPHANIRFF